MRAAIASAPSAILRCRSSIRKINPWILGFLGERRTRKASIAATVAFSSSVGTEGGAPRPTFGSIAEWFAGVDSHGGPMMRGHFATVAKSTTMSGAANERCVMALAIVKAIAPALLRGTRAQLHGVCRSCDLGELSHRSGCGLILSPKIQGCGQSEGVGLITVTAIPGNLSL